MLPAAYSQAVDVMQLLQSDWQTVGALAAEICAPDTDAPCDGDGTILIVRLCARLYALSRVETELLYPCLTDVALRRSGSHLHDRMVTNLHAVLDAVMGPDSVDSCVHELARDMVSLHQFEMDLIYPQCDPACMDGVVGRMLNRRLELLERFTER